MNGHHRQFAPGFEASLWHCTLPRLTADHQLRIPIQSTRSGTLTKYEIFDLYRRKSWWSWTKKTIIFHYGGSRKFIMKFVFQIYEISLTSRWPLWGWRANLTFLEGENSRFWKAKLTFLDGLQLWVAWNNITGCKVIYQGGGAQNVCRSNRSNHRALSVARRPWQTWVLAFHTMSWSFDPYP